MMNCPLPLPPPYCQYICPLSIVLNFILDAPPTPQTPSSLAWDKLCDHSVLAAKQSTKVNRSYTCGLFYFIQTLPWLWYLMPTFPSCPT